MSDDAIIGIFLAILSTIILSGGFVLVYICFQTRLDSVFVKFVFKLLVILVRLTSIAIPAVTALIFWDELPEKQFWQTTVTILGGSGWALWETNQLIADLKANKTTSINEYKWKAQVRQTLIRTTLLTHLRRLVDIKKERVIERLEPFESLTRSIQTVRDTLKPTVQIRHILERMTEVLRALHEEPNSEAAVHQRFRVGLYVPDENQYLRPQDAFDTENRDKNPFRSYHSNKEHFLLTNTHDPSEAVRCIQEGTLRIVSDCDAENQTSGSFVYLREEQRAYLKSLIAHPIIYRDLQTGQNQNAALLVDTNISGYFRVEDCGIIEFALKEFSARIVLELALLNLVTKSEASS